MYSICQVMKKAIPNKWAISLALTTGVVRCNVWTMVLLLCHDAFKLCGFWFWIGYQYALLPEAGPSPPHSQAGTLVAIHKSGQAGKAVISAGMPKSRPWTVTTLDSGIHDRNDGGIFIVFGPNWELLSNGLCSSLCRKPSKQAILLLP